MVDPIKTFFNIGIEDIFGFEANVIIDRFDGIVRTTSGPEPIGVGFKDCFPFWFQGQFDQSLSGSVEHGGYA